MRPVSGLHAFFLSHKFYLTTAASTGQRAAILPCDYFSRHPPYPQGSAVFCSGNYFSQRPLHPQGSTPPLEMGRTSSSATTLPPNRLPTEKDTILEMTVD